MKNDFERQEADIVRSINEDKIMYSSAPAKSRGGYIILVIVMLILSSVGVISGVLFFITDSQRTPTTQSGRAYEKYHDVSRRTITAIEKLEDFDGPVIDMTSYQILQDDVDELRDYVVIAKTEIVALPENTLSTEVPFSTISSALDSLKTYLATRKCVINTSSEYSTEYTSINGLMVFPLTPPTESNYDSELQKYTKIRDSVLHLRNMSVSLQECFGKGHKYTKTLLNDTDAMNRYLSEFLNPYVKLLASKDSAAISAFWGKNMSKSRVTISWGPMIIKYGQVNRDFDTQRKALEKAKEEILKDDKSLKSVANRG